MIICIHSPTHGVREIDTGDAKTFTLDEMKALIKAQFKGPFQMLTLDHMAIIHQEMRVEHGTEILKLVKESGDNTFTAYLCRPRLLSLDEADETCGMGMKSK